MLIFCEFLSVAVQVPHSWFSSSLPGNNLRGTKELSRSAESFNLRFIWWVLGYRYSSPLAFS